jgi:hypothetical protein
VRRQLSALPRDLLLDEKLLQLNRIIQECAGIAVLTTTQSAEVTPDEEVTLHHRALVRSDLSVRWIGTATSRRPAESAATSIFPGSSQTRALGRGVILLPDTRWRVEGIPPEHPYWLVGEGRPGLFGVVDSSLIGLPENPPVLYVWHRFVIGGDTLTVQDEPIEEPQGRMTFESRRRLVVIPPVSLSFSTQADVFPVAATKTVNIAATASRGNVAGRITLDVPSGWRVSPAARDFSITSAGQSIVATFSVTAPRGADRAELSASAQIGAARYGSERVEVRYNHIPVQLLHSRARLRVASLDLITRGKKVGYLPGAGDAIPASLEQMGYEVRNLVSESDFSSVVLDSLDAIVLGVRAVNVSEMLPGVVRQLHDHVQRGGVLIAQYGRPDQLRTTGFAPFPLTLGDDRVTDENARVTFLAPEHAVLNRPNRITAADFEGWVQELGLYFGRSWDERFVPIIAASDEGEAPLRGALLVAPHGRGYFVYTGLSFFRQLPAGVPGAYRLFANLIALGER